MKMNNNLIYVLTGLDYGGAEMQVIQLAREARQRNYNVTLIVLITPVAFQDELIEEGINVISLHINSFFDFFRGLFKFNRILSTFNSPVVHAHMIHANIFTRLANLLGNNSSLTINTAHSVNEGGNFRMLLYRLTNSLCDLSTQVSAKGLTKYIDNKAYSKKNSIYIPNGIVICSHSGRNVRKCQHSFVWLTVGRLVDVKNHDDLLVAFSKVCTTVKDVSLIIVGKGELEYKLKEQAVNLGINKKVKFLGVRDDISQLMKSADAFVLSSKYEGLPMVLLEASEARIPILSTDVGGVGEMISNGVNGFLVASHSAIALEKGMKQVMSLSNIEIDKITLSSYEKLINDYSMINVFDKWESFYLGLHLDIENSK